MEYPTACGKPGYATHSASLPKHHVSHNTSKLVSSVAGCFPLTVCKGSEGNKSSVAKIGNPSAPWPGRHSSQLLRRPTHHLASVSG
eukprot:scaffold2088_cov399-Prasinococcus_capsulatus_cf.AAC.26